ncbi:MAG: extracellular solute-binding protein [Lachnospiraceae bacterium]|nr:extracellular solute-binding protein [Lachnospiraceae bacterium]
MKKLIALILVALLSVTLIACAGADSGGNDTDTAADTTTEAADDDAGADDTTDTGNDDTAGAGGTINLWSFTDEVPNMVDRFKELNPDFPYNVEVTIISTTDGAYQPALDGALVGGGSDAPDIFAAEAAFVLRYTQGDMSEFALPYADLGIDVDALIAEAQIASYTVDIGTRDGQVVGLGFQATGGAVIYRRSIAQDVWGTDDPDEVAGHIGGGSASWDQFMNAAREMDAAGYSMVSGAGDLWQVARNTGSPWINADNELYIAAERLAFMDVHRELYEGGLMNDTTAWSDAWFADMAGVGAREVFAFLGPAWLINYVMAGNSGGDAPGEGTFGDWGVAVPPQGFFWGGTWLIANAQGNEEVRSGVAQLIEWITLNSTEEGLQYKWANGTLFGEGGTKDVVASATVMDKADGTVEFLGGQDMFDIFIPAGEYASGTVLTQYDESINDWFMDASTEYATGSMTREEAIEFFKQQVASNLAVTVNFD